MKLISALVLSLAFCISSPAQSSPVAAPANTDIVAYIANSWNTLTRSIDRCETLIDPKLPAHSVLYLPAELPITDAEKALAQRCNVRVQNLPFKIERLGQLDVSAIQPHGLLLLRNPYVVPGGRFNEMYGWDSYFIILGLLRDGRIDLARGMVENFLFEIEHYGAVLNANRTYFLTRSQPPFLTSMILAVYDAGKKNGKEDRAWLTRAYELAAKDYGLWIREPHLAGSTGLSRYYDFGECPVPEERPNTKEYYREVLHGMLQRLNTTYVDAAGSLHPDWPTFTVFTCSGTPSAPADKDCSRIENVGLSPDFYKGDRSMRESGFDISFRFGSYSAETHHYAPVCLNSLLYKTEKDMERIATMLGLAAEAKNWSERARRRQILVQKYLWDDQRGLYFDYNFTNNTRSTYEYITTFYPLWAGLASPEQARAVMRNLATFEHPGGLAMSSRETRVQWDFPYGWAPVQLLAIEGMRRYGFEEDANRVSYEWLSNVLENYRRDGTIREKYNVVTRSSETPVSAGYKTNVVGFGWTNGVYLELLKDLPRAWVDKLQSVGRAAKD